MLRNIGGDEDVGSRMLPLPTAPGAARSAYRVVLARARSTSRGLGHDRKNEAASMIMRMCSCTFEDYPGNPNDWLSCANAKLLFSPFLNLVIIIAAMSDVTRDIMVGINEPFSRAV